MYPLSHLMLAKTLWVDVTAYPSIVDEETEAQAGYVTCLRSYREVRGKVRIQVYVTLESMNCAYLGS